MCDMSGDSRVAGRKVHDGFTCRRGRDDDEGPQRQVTIPKPFAVGKYAVTVGQYAEFVRETKHRTGNCYDSKSSWDDPGFKQTNDHPVVCVSWDDASSYDDASNYVYWLSLKTRREYRLLTEAEWEYAARAGTTTPYYFGRMISANMAEYYSNGTASVGSFPANAFRLHDMHGNVWEWVEDCWHDYYTDAPTNGDAWLSRCRRGNEDDCEGSASWVGYCKKEIVGKNYACCVAALGSMYLRACAPLIATKTTHLAGTSPPVFELPVTSPHKSPNGAVEKVPPLPKRNRLRHQIYENGRGGFAYLP